MRVLSVQHYPAFGGPHNEIIQLEPHLNRLNISTIVAITDDPGDAYGRIRDSVEIHRVPLGRFRQPPNVLKNANTVWRMRRDIESLRSLIRACKPDIVKVHGVHNPQGVIAANLENTPVVLVISSDLPHPLFRRLGIRLQRSHVDAVLSTGTRVLDAYPGHESLLDRIFPYIPPVDTEKYRPGDQSVVAAAKVELGVSPDEFVIGTVANINYQKGIDRLVDVAAEVLPNVPNASFVVIGGIADTQRDYYAEILKSLKDKALPEERFRFIGSRSDLHLLLPGLDLKLLPSRAEGIPTTMLEAMSAGLAVVGTDVGSVSEIIVSGINGETTPVNGIEQMAAAIIRLANDVGLRNRYGESARSTALDLFSSQGCAIAHQQAYQHAVAYHRRIVAE